MIDNIQTKSLAWFGHIPGTYNNLIPKIHEEEYVKKNKK